MTSMPDHDASWDDAVIVAFGSNLRGEYRSREALLESAIDRLAVAEIVIRRRSRWRRTAAWPDPAQPQYLNGVAIVETGLEPEALLRRLLAVEAAFGRQRRAGDTPHAPRTLDLDLIAYGRLRMVQPDLTLPHPLAHQRAFVMGPLAEIAPAWRHPVTGERASDLWSALARGAATRG